MIKLKVTHTPCEINLISFLKIAFPNFKLKSRETGVATVVPFTDLENHRFKLFPQILLHPLCNIFPFPPAFYRTRRVSFNSNKSPECLSNSCPVTFLDFAASGFHCWGMSDPHGPIASVLYIHLDKRPPAVTVFYFHQQWKCMETAASSRDSSSNCITITLVNRSLTISRTKKVSNNTKNLSKQRTRFLHLYIPSIAQEQRHQRRSNSVE